MVFNLPDSLKALPVAETNAGDKVEILGSYKSYYLMSSDNTTGWITLKE